MSSTLERFAGHRYAPGYERMEDPLVVEGLAGLGEFWPVVGALMLLWVILARSVRRRRPGPNSKLIRDLEAAARQETFRQIGTDLRLRHEAGEYRDR